MEHIANCMRRGVDKLVNVYLIKDSPPASDLTIDFSCLGDESDLHTEASSINIQPEASKSPARSPGVTWGDILHEEKDMALPMVRSGTSMSDTALNSGRETPQSWRRGGSLSRRREVKVLELAPMAPPAAMTTVQEGGLDSPTIPGRPPLRKVLSSESNYRRDTPRYPGHERSISAPQHGPYAHVAGEFTNPRAPVPIPPRKYTTDNQRSSPKTKGQALNSSKSLSPIFSPCVSWPEKPATVPEDDLPQPLNFSPSRAGSPQNGRQTPLRIETPLVHAGFQRVDSPHEAKPEVPPKPSPIHITAKLPKTPKTPPKPWPIRHSSSMSNLRSLPGQVSAPVGDIFGRPSTASLEKRSPTGHHRNQSETSILDRGRPVKRSPSTKKKTSTPVTSPKGDDGNWKLPNGLRPSEAVVRMPESEKEVIRRQANGQAEKFEILGSRNVTSLSRELRALDERCEYLRSTYKSLRAGRLKLHHRMISYLKSDSLQFSKESILRQEEALIELDKSIDDWILKLEQAENRRLRVRQKLLEHVAAAMTLNPIATAPAPAGPSTPPGSPVRMEARSPEPVNRRDVESIKIYADGQVLNLFSDIEQAVDRMCMAC